jgi:hypothetical protein
MSTLVDRELRMQGVPMEEPMKGPLTIIHEQAAEKYRFKAETIVRWFDELGMTTEEKVKYLQNEFAGLEMYWLAHPNGDGR